MFKIECFCADNKLHLVHRALNGLVYNLTANLVTNLPNKAETDEQTPETAKEFILKCIRKQIGTKITSSQIRTAVVDAGWGAASAAYVTQRLIKEKVLLKTNTPGEYKVSKRRSKQ